LAWQEQQHNKAHMLLYARLHLHIKVGGRSFKRCVLAKELNLRKYLKFNVFL
jgi:hypothetical protein